MATLEIVSPGPLEAEDVTTADESMSLRPIFYGNGREAANAAVIKVLNDRGEVVHTYILKMNGANLGLSLLNRTKPVKPLYERPRKGKKDGDTEEE